MAIAQMNWGLLLFPLSDPRMAEFTAALEPIYRLAEEHPGFIWRIGDDQAAEELRSLDFDEKMSATISVWHSVDDLRAYTYQSEHGTYLKRAAEWFAPVTDPQLILWDVEPTARPTFAEAFDRLESFKSTGPSAHAYGWPD